MELSLAPQVSFCFVAEHAVFMDVARNGYLALPVARLESGEALEALRERGLLVGSGKRGEAVAPVQASPATELLGEEGSRPPAWARHALPCGLACASAALALRFLPLARIVGRVAERRQCASRAFPFDARLASELTRAFQWLRPLAPISAHGSLFDSLALIELLARHGLFPHWVFGVKTWPFDTFCWVQHGTVLLGGSLERVRGFTPVRVV